MANSNIFINFTYPKELKVIKMLQSEFKERTGVDVSFDEYQAIEKVYMASDLDKDEFCKTWCKMNASRIKAAKKAMAEKVAKDKARTRLFNIIRKLEKERHYNIAEEPLTVSFLSESDVTFLQKIGIQMRISFQEAVDYGYHVPRHYRIS